MESCNKSIIDSGKLSTSRLGYCEICHSSEAKYVCPGCECRSCCLKCIQIHKEQFQCNGERDQTKYVSFKNKDINNDLVLSSDICLMEEITRKRESLYKAARQSKGLHPNRRKLELAAAARKIKLRFYPSLFKSHKNNSSHFDSQQNLIYWHIDWYFMNADNLKLSNMKVSEIQKLSSIMRQHLETNNENLKKKLLFYKAASFSNIKVLLRAENKAGKKFYEVNLSDNLRECLKNKTIIEYPVFHVILADHKFGFDIIDSGNFFIKNA